MILVNVNMFHFINCITTTAHKKIWSYICVWKTVDRFMQPLEKESTLSENTKNWKIFILQNYLTLTSSLQKQTLEPELLIWAPEHYRHTLFLCKEDWQDIFFLNTGLHHRHIRISCFPVIFYLQPCDVISLTIFKLS